MDMKNQSKLVALLALSSLALVTGCAEEAQTHAKTPVEIITMDASGAAKIPVNLADGKSPRLGPGQPAAFWIGRHPSGEFYVRATTAKTQHRFQGRIHAQKGELTNFRPSRMDHNDRFKFEGKDVVFDITTNGDEDGFEFGAKDACIEFDLRIDGKKLHDRIFIGKDEAKTPSAHFTLCQ